MEISVHVSSVSAHSHGFHPRLAATLWARSWGCMSAKELSPAAAAAALQVPGSPGKRDPAERVARPPSSPRLLGAAAPSAPSSSGRPGRPPGAPLTRAEAQQEQRGTSSPADHGPGGGCSGGPQPYTTPAGGSGPFAFAPPAPPPPANRFPGPQDRPSAPSARALLPAVGPAASPPPSLRFSGGLQRSSRRGLRETAVGEGMPLSAHRVPHF